MVKYISINNKKYPVRVGYSALVQCKEKHGKSFEAMGSDDLEMFETVLWASLVSGSKQTGEELDLDKADIQFYLDDCLLEFRDVIQDFFVKMTEKTQPLHPKTKKK